MGERYEVCSTCKGQGRVEVFDETLLIPLFKPCSCGATGFDGSARAWTEKDWEKSGEKEQDYWRLQEGKRNERV